MTVFHFPVLGISADRVWFSKGEVLKSDAQIVRYMRIPIEEDRFKGIFVSRDKNDTLIHDLSESEGDIRMHFSKTYRYDVNRGQKDENVSFEFFDEECLASENGKEIILKMREAYAGLLEQKADLGMKNNYRQNETELFAAKKSW